ISYVPEAFAVCYIFPFVCRVGHETGMEAIIFIGIQGTGKSSFYQARFFRTHVRISLDMLKTRNREQLLLRACIEGKQPFVIDNTNVTVTERARYIEPAKGAGFRVYGYYFKSNLRDALERNKGRTGLERIPDPSRSDD